MLHTYATYATHKKPFIYNELWQIFACDVA